MVEFSQDDLEWMQAICRFLEIEWNLQVKISITTDYNHFKKYDAKAKVGGHHDKAGCFAETGLCWFNPDKHVTEPKVQLLNSIVHEILHCKYPQGTEKQIKSLTDIKVPIQ